MAAPKKPAPAARTTKPAKKHEEERSPQWEEFRRKFIAQNPKCVCCGKTEDETALQAHHVFPFHYCKKLGRGELELDARNLITLCETERGKPSNNHHELIGHFGDFESSNLDVRTDVRSPKYRNKAKDQIKADADWQARRKNRLPHLEKMTDDELAAFRWAMQEVYPAAGKKFPQPKIRFPWLPVELQKKIPK